jgi:UDP-N-acetylglucosamine 1-carboxyvinyltransferase
MSNFIINGGQKLSGEINTNSAKNSAVAILCATTLIKGETTLVNVPVIEEVKRIIEILISLGMTIEWTGEHELKIINPGNLKPDNIDRDAYIKTRSGLLLMGALARQDKEFKLPQSSGCRLGKRTVSPYTIAMEHLGYQVECEENFYHIKKVNPQGSEFTMSEMGDTATENTILAAVLTPGKTVLHFASSNYMTQDLCYFLLAAGAKIKGIGTPTIAIEGAKKLKPVKDYPIMPDPIESMAFISIAITTGSKLKIKSCPIDFLRLELTKLKLMGQKFEFSKPYRSANGKFDLLDIVVIPSSLTALPDKLHPQPYPGLNIDNLPLFLPILTQVQGQTLVHDWVYENRAIYYIELNKLGADIMLLDPHRVTVTGPTKLKANEIICPPALRPSINLLICMLAAEGRSILRNSYSIDRGYENIVTRLNKLGADITAIEKLDL